MGLLAMVAACVPLPPQPPAQFHRSGQAKTYNSAYEDVYQASVDALEDIGLKIKRDDVQTGELLADSKETTPDRSQEIGTMGLRSQDSAPCNRVGVFLDRVSPSETKVEIQEWIKPFRQEMAGGMLVYQPPTTQTCQEKAPEFKSRLARLLRERGAMIAKPFPIPAAPMKPGLAPADAPASAERGVVVVDGRSPADYVSSQYGRAWAVVIGINDYRNNIPRLKYAVADAKAVGATLQAQGFSVIGLYDEQATRSRILEVLGDELPEKVKRGDRVAIFYAGHGDTKSVEDAQEMGYLLPVDAQRDRLHKTSINMGEIRQLAALLPAKHVLFLVDVCYGGIAGTQFRGLPPQTAAYLKQITKERGRQLITAGGPGQQVVEGPQWGHSVFTYYLLEGLKGLADLNDDGIIPASELYAFLDGRVPAAADNQQRPEMWSLAADKGEFVFMTPKSVETKTAK